MPERQTGSALASNPVDSAEELTTKLSESSTLSVLTRASNHLEASGVRLDKLGTCFTETTLDNVTSDSVADCLGDDEADTSGSTALGGTDVDDDVGSRGANTLVHDSAEVSGLIDSVILGEHDSSLLRLVVILTLS
jgi:hypothetical protein